MPTKTAPDQKRICRSCSAVLSRYNPEGQCSPCQGRARREKFAQDQAREAGTEITPAIQVQADQIASNLERRSPHADPTRTSEQRWCEGCQKYRHAGAWGKYTNICRFCAERPVPQPEPPSAVVVTREIVAEPQTSEAVMAAPEVPEAPEPSPDQDTAPRASGGALRPGEWSRLHSQCVICSKTDSPHASRGWCQRCRNERRGTLLTMAMRAPTADESGVDYHVLNELISVLPKDGKWSPTARKYWTTAFGNLLSYLTAQPSCAEGEHIACSHYRGVAEEAMEQSTESGWCVGCGAERPYDGQKPLNFEHKEDCPLAAIVQGEL